MSSTYQSQVFCLLCCQAQNTALFLMPSSSQIILAIPPIPKHCSKAGILSLCWTIAISPFPAHVHFEPVTETAFPVPQMLVFSVSAVSSMHILRIYREICNRRFLLYMLPFYISFFYPILRNTLGFQVLLSDVWLGWQVKFLEVPKFHF